MSVRRGAFVSERDSYYKRYHAAFCGIAGLMPLRFDALNAQNSQTLDVNFDSKAFEKCGDNQKLSRLAPFFI
jgi:hypothetical protein